MLEVSLSWRARGSLFRAGLLPKAILEKSYLSIIESMYGFLPVPLYQRHNTWQRHTPVSIVIEQHEARYDFRLTRNSSPIIT